MSSSQEGAVPVNDSRNSVVPASVRRIIDLPVPPTITQAEARSAYALMADYRYRYHKERSERRDAQRVVTELLKRSVFLSAVLVRHLAGRRLTLEDMREVQDHLNSSQSHDISATLQTVIGIIDSATQIVSDSLDEQYGQYMRDTAESEVGDSVNMDTLLDRVNEAAHEL